MYKRDSKRNCIILQRQRIIILFMGHDCEDEKTCKTVVEECTYNTGIFIGDFVKAILKINNIATELESICLEMNQLELLKKVREIPGMTMKFVATNQSLYV